MAEVEKTLLPIGGELELGGRPLHIAKRLDAGLTGEVYEGTLLLEEQPTRVAIKAMRPLQFAMARQLFEGEALTLSLMQGYEEDANKQQRLNLKVAPIYYGRGEHKETQDAETGIPYLVMEFIEGQPLPKLLKQKTKLPEDQALLIAWHLYRTLDIMHRQLKKSYIDLKLDNLWWVERAEQLKLTDFGTLEDVKEEEGRPVARGVQRDLLLAGVYLCAMVTGYTLDYSLGRLRELADPILRRSEMSWGTRRLLRRLLHRNPDVRPQKAAEVAGELRILVNFWQQQPPATLLDIADANLLRAEDAPDSDRGRDYAARAMAALDIARRLLGDSDRLRAALDRADRILARSDYLERGRALFEGQSYKPAREIFEQGMEWSDNPAVLRRWAYVALIGDEVPSVIYDQYRAEVLAAVERLNEGNWTAAIDRLAALASHLPGKGLAALLADARLFKALDDANRLRDRDYGAAAAAYRATLRDLDSLPYADFVRREEVGDLRRLAEDQERLAETAGKAASSFQTLISEYKTATGSDNQNL